jgi:hypothetical protein
MTTPADHPLVTDYLRRFDEAASGIREPRRSQLRAEVAAHLREATTPEMDLDAVDDVIAELGSPEAIVAEETVQQRLHVRRSWVAAGAPLIASVCIGPILQWSVFGGLSSTLADLLWGAALVVFAVSRDSVTARRPLGTIALLVLAVLPLAVHSVNGAFAAGLARDHPDFVGLTVLGYGGSLTEFIVAAVAVVQIARIRVVPPPWRWAPTWALGIIAAVWILEQVTGLSLGADGADAGATLAALEGIAGTGAAVVLGILAIGLGLGALRSPARAPSSGP